MAKETEFYKDLFKLNTLQAKVLVKHIKKLIVIAKQEVFDDIEEHYEAAWIDELKKKHLKS